MKKFPWLYKNKPEKIFDVYIENRAKVQNPNINDNLQSVLTMDTRLLVVIFACLGCRSAFADNEMLAQILEKLQIIEERLETVKKNNKLKVNCKTFSNFCNFPWTSPNLSPNFTDAIFSAWCETPLFAGIKMLIQNL